MSGFDYTSVGAYFVTICAYQREHLFGRIQDGKMELNAIGEVLKEEWLKTAKIRREIELDAFIVMPNHFHGIISIRDVGAHGYVPLGSDAPLGSDHAPRRASQNVDGSGNAANPSEGAHPWGGAHNHAPLRRPKSLSTWVTGFKWGTTTRINDIRNTSGMRVWQRNYYERIIRDDRELFAVREYIRNNPQKWHEDPENNPVKALRSYTSTH